MTTKYSLRFRHIDPRVVRLTRDLFKSKPWRLEAAEQIEATQRWARDVCEVYSMDPPVDVQPGFLMGGGGFFHYPSNTIIMEKLSVTTLAHEFRHAMQYSNLTPVTDFEDHWSMEDDARAWSLSLIRLAAPRRFHKMVADGRIRFEGHEDEYARPQPEVEEG